MAHHDFASSRVFSGHVMPVEIDCRFTVASADAAGLGITGLVGAYVQNVFMNTSAAAGPGNRNGKTPNTAVVNPNPSAGAILIQLQDSYTQLYGLEAVSHSPPGVDQVVTAGLTVGAPYQITILGDATLADWRAIGVPLGVTPAVGVGFIAASTGAGAAVVSRVAPAAAAGSGIFQYELIGNPTLSLANQVVPSGYGGYLLLQARNASGVGAASAIVAPANGTIIRVKMLLSNSSVLVQGS